MPGLKLVSRGGLWYAAGSVAGQRVRKSLGTRDKAKAVELCAHYEAKLWKRHSYGEAAVRTFDEAALSFLEQGGDGRFVPRVLGYFKGRAVGSITGGDVREMAIKLYPLAGPRTRNRQAIAPARAIINHGHERGWCNPIKVRQFDAPKSRKHTPVDRVWLDAFMAQADADGLPHLSAAVLFMHQTAARVSEAVHLLGDHVSLERRLAVLVKTKTEEDSPRGLTSELVARIAALDPKPGRPVFLYTDPKAVNRRMAAVCARAGIERRTTHSAGRHSFGTNAVKVGVKEAMDAGGWKSARLFMETYVHSTKAAKSVSDHFDRETGPIDANQAQSIKRHARRFGKHNGK